MLEMNQLVSIIVLFTTFCELQNIHVKELVSEGAVNRRMSWDMVKPWLELTALFTEQPTADSNKTIRKKPPLSKAMANHTCAPGLKEAQC